MGPLPPCHMALLLSEPDGFQEFRKSSRVRSRGARSSPLPRSPPTRRLPTGGSAARRPCRGTQL